MAAMPPSDDDRPATRRELFKEREVIEANMRAEFALVRQEMAEGFAALRKEFTEALGALRKEFTEALSALRKEMVTKAELRAEIGGLRRELRLFAMVSLAMWATLGGLIVRSG